MAHKRVCLDRAGIYTMLFEIRRCIHRPLWVISGGIPVSAMRKRPNGFFKCAGPNGRRESAVWQRPFGHCCTPGDAQSETGESIGSFTQLVMDGCSQAACIHGEPYHRNVKASSASFFPIRVRRSPVQPIVPLPLKEGALAPLQQSANCGPHPWVFQ
jgi:hypothetical protein